MRSEVFEKEVQVEKGNKEEAQLPQLAWPGQAYRGQERVCGGINQEGLEGVAAAQLALPGPKSARGRHFKPSQRLPS